MTETLAVWLWDEHVADLERLRNGRNRLRFTTSALGRWGVGARPLSYSLPLTDRRVESRALDAWLDNLLPEGPVRSSLERRYRVRPGDALELLSHVGYECAGAVRFVRPGVEPPTGFQRDLRPDEVDEIVADLPTINPPDELAVTASLGGVQAKVLLTRTATGWAWPADGAMSSHIIKPEPTTPDTPVPEVIEYEEWALRLARRAGVAAADASLESFGGRRALVVERYDRDRARRIHQEDFAQSLGLAASDKYEGRGREPGRLETIARGPAEYASSPRDFRTNLLAAVTFNLVIGNGDAHAKNYSTVIGTDGQYELAPLYDVAPVFLVSARFETFGFRIGGQTSLRRLGRAQLLAEAASWGMARDAAERVVEGTASRVASAARSIETSALIEPVREQVVRRAREIAGEELGT
jgi:serine/threonine-protein kinase HipA